MSNPYLRTHSSAEHVGTQQISSMNQTTCIYNLLLYIMYALLKMYGKKMLGFSVVTESHNEYESLKTSARNAEETAATKHAEDLFHLLRPSRAYMGLFHNPRHQQDLGVQPAVKVIRFCSFCSDEGLDKMK